MQWSRRNATGSTIAPLALLQQVIQHVRDLHIDPLTHGLRRTHRPPTRFLCLRNSRRQVSPPRGRGEEVGVLRVAMVKRAPDVAVALRQWANPRLGERVGGCDARVLVCVELGKLRPPPKCGKHPLEWHREI